MKYAYLFEAKSIQTFLFASGKLKDLISGSELLHQLTEAPIDEVLNAVGASEGDYTFTRKAGGAFFVVFNNKNHAQDFQRLWNLVSVQLLPGIELTEALAEGESKKEALEQGRGILQSARNFPTPPIPAASPITQRCARTGNPVVELQNNEPVDVDTQIKRQYAKSLNKPSENTPKTQTLTSRFYQDHNILWPNNFEEDARDELRFPVNKDNMVGIVHIDGNGLGEILRVLGGALANLSDDDTYCELYKNFSDNLAEATCKAAAEATALLADHAKPLKGKDKSVMPARPVVLGGDDVTIIIRADLAIPFSRAFIESFETLTKPVLDDLRNRMKSAALDETKIKELPDQLTACGGIAFLKANQPFSQGYELAESLCERAKNTSRQQPTDQGIPSSLAIHEVESTLFANADTLFTQELCSPIPPGTDTFNSLAKESSHPKAEAIMELGCQAYGVGSLPSSLPQLSHFLGALETLANSKLNLKSLRAMATTLYHDFAAAEKHYQRWRQQSQKHSEQEYEQYINQIQTLLPQADFISNGPDASLPGHYIRANNGEDRHRLIFPLIDFLRVYALQQKPSAEE